MAFGTPLPLYTRSLAIVAIHVVLLSTLFSVYDVKVPVIKWVTQKIWKVSSCGFILINYTGINL